MTTDRILPKDADEAWIAKYRAAVKEVRVEPSRSSKIREALHRAGTLALSGIGRILHRLLGSRSQASAQQRSSQPPETSAVPPQSASEAIPHLTQGLPPLTGKALMDENQEGWREKPVA